MLQRAHGLADCDHVDTVTVKIKLLELAWQVLDSTDGVERQVEHLEAREAIQLVVHLYDALGLHVKGAEELDDELFLAEVGRWTKLLDELCQFDCVGRPIMIGVSE